MSEINANLRDHVQRIGFDLSLGRTHIAALVYIEELRLVKWRGDLLSLPNPGRMSDPPIARAFANFVTGAHGLQSRGLLTHSYTDSDKPKFEKRTDGTWLIQHSPKVWKVTPAGRLVIKLLKEAGIWQDYSVLLVRRESEAAAS